MRLINNDPIIQLSKKFNNKNWKFSNEGNPNIYLLQKKGKHFNF